MEVLELAVEWFSLVVDLSASAIMAWAFIVAMMGFVSGSMKAATEPARIKNLQAVRCSFGIKLVFALELMIVSDLLRTIITHTLDDILAVGALVLIRTVIAYFLNKEIEEVHMELQK